ncbi:hypothetical protein BLNAU_22289 [Blattamonas nauphoetae]|uniref:Uncharacterized protein n=1 Tax=Blattamonas nauphoetae TaxID=2049346 RepID=A0ABQ9WTJ2_9EUKA|nr:hypothetical protein BLNAU_22289 [Blattamonas nauphoetae]
MGRDDEDANEEANTIADLQLRVTTGYTKHRFVRDILGIKDDGQRILEFGLDLVIPQDFTSRSHTQRGMMDPKGRVKEAERKKERKYSRAGQSHTVIGIGRRPRPLRPQRLTLLRLHQTACYRKEDTQPTPHLLHPTTPNPRLTQTKLRLGKGMLLQMNSGEFETQNIEDEGKQDEDDAYCKEEKGQKEGKKEGHDQEKPKEGTTEDRDKEEAEEVAQRERNNRVPGLGTGPPAGVPLYPQTHSFPFSHLPPQAFASRADRGEKHKAQSSSAHQTIESITHFEMYPIPGIEVRFSRFAPLFALSVL